jgi:predicted DCC family thiol-disulfide oxidoreductase YuxK
VVIEKSSTVLFDGECNLCSGAVDFIRSHDKEGRFRFVPLDAAEARDLLAARDAGCDTLHLLDKAGHHDRSAAVLRIAADLPFPWSLVRFLKIVPRPLRDACYDFVARHRRRWFGRAPRRPLP